MAYIYSFQRSMLILFLVTIGRRARIKHSLWRYFLLYKSVHISGKLKHCAPHCLLIMNSFIKPRTAAWQSRNTNNYQTLLPLVPSTTWWVLCITWSCTRILTYYLVLLHFGALFWSMLCLRGQSFGDEYINSYRSCSV